MSEVSLSDMNLDEIDRLLLNWEEVYKKGLLTFWLLLLLHERAAYAYEINDAVQKISQGTISADNNSIYRALSRFEALGIVTSDLRQSDIGPARKYYGLSEKGVLLIGKFIQRNILLFETPLVAERIRNLLKSAGLKSEEA
ncbi:MAG TPA: helix-turn-helix transcriptional regulator [Anaerolineales bacterium]|jgi:DNA-binding PadR family transcriptional regulator